MILRQKFFGVLDAGGSDLASEESGKFLKPLFRVQAFNHRERAGFGHALGDLKMG